MGVPKFYRWISERYPCLSEVVKEYQIPEFDNLYLDMNGIVHICSHPEDDNPHFRITEEKIFQDIFHYLEVLFRMIKPNKVFFMAIDGVAPRAKMNQQRGRRFRSAREAEELQRKALEKGEILPTEARFDSNCITPGTPFMVRLQEQLKYFIVKKLTTDKMWQGVDVYLSGHETPGEGEHKVMDFIRWEKSQPGYDPNTRHCLYGLDADLIMLGLVTHEPHFSLLREEVRFGGKNSQKRSNTAEETTFHLLHLSLMREYLDFEFGSLKDKLPFGYDLDNIIDDWVLMGFLVGNDFIPHLPHMHIHSECLPMLWKVYKRVIPSLDGYLSSNGHLNLGRFEKFLAELAQNDKEQFNEQYADLKWMESKVGKRPINEDAARAKAEASKKGYQKSKTTGKSSITSDLAGIPTANEFMMLKDIGEDDCQGKPLKAFEFEQGGFDEEEYEDDDMFDAEFSHHKAGYYMEKMEYKQVTPEVLKEQAEGYVRAIAWILQYYYNGVPSWSWYYPHHYAPYLSDVKNFKDMNIALERSTPFHPFEQLMAVLPAASKSLLPKPLQTLMVSETSPVIDYYPTDFKTDLNGKMQEWEAVVLIPFIDEKRLLGAMKPIETQLTDVEKARNRHGPALLYRYTEEILGVYISGLPGAFPDIVNHHAKLTEVPMETFWITPDRLKKGLCEGVKQDLYFPGFPTLKHIEHSAHLRKDGVKVFQQNSRGENMILEILAQPSQDTEQVAQDLIGNSVYVAWPHLMEARVISVQDDETKYSIVENHGQGQRRAQGADGVEIKATDMSMDEKKRWHKEVVSIQEVQHDRKGVDIGLTDILLYACPMSGRKYTCGSRGLITLEKQWANNAVPFPIQATVKDIAVKDPTFQQFKTLDELFPVTSEVFMLGNPHYGCVGEVLSIEAKNDGRIRVDFTILQEPDFTEIRQQQQNLSARYMPGYVCAQRIGISGFLLSRITGVVFVMRGCRDRPVSAKVNIGLNLKFNKTQMEVPGYTKKSNGDWLYSTLLIDVVSKYIQDYPELFQYITSTDKEANYYEEDIWGNAGKEKLQGLTKYIKELPCSKVSVVRHGSKLLDELIVKELEKEVDDVKERNKKKKKHVKMQVRPHLLYRPLDAQLTLIPDPSAVYELFDRVVNVRDGYSVPLGMRGTVIGISHGDKEQDTSFDVVYDDEFLGGLGLRCSSNKGYKMPSSAMINLSYGERKEMSRKGGGQKPTAVVKPQYTPGGTSYSQMLSRSGDNRRANGGHQSHKNQGYNQNMGNEGNSQQGNRSNHPGNASQHGRPHHQKSTQQQNQAANDEFANIWQQLQNSESAKADTSSNSTQRSREAGQGSRRGAQPKAKQGAGPGPSLQQAAKALENVHFEHRWQPPQGHANQAKDAAPTGGRGNTNQQPQQQKKKQQSMPKKEPHQAAEGGQKIDVNALFDVPGRVDIKKSEIAASNQAGNDEFASILKALEGGDTQSDMVYTNSAYNPPGRQDSTQEGTKTLCQMLKIGPQDPPPPQEQKKSYGKQVSLNELFQGASVKPNEAEPGPSQRGQKNVRVPYPQHMHQQQPPPPHGSQQHPPPPHGSQQQPPPPHGSQQHPPPPHPSQQHPPPPHPSQQQHQQHRRSAVLDLAGMCQNFNLFATYEYQPGRDNKVRAIISLSNGALFQGSYARSRELAAESAAGATLLNMQPCLQPPMMAPPHGQRYPPAQYGGPRAGNFSASPNSAFTPVQGKQHGNHASYNNKQPHPGMHNAPHSQGPFHSPHQPFPNNNQTQHHNFLHTKQGHPHHGSQSKQGGEWRGGQQHWNNRPRQEDAKGVTEEMGGLSLEKPAPDSGPKTPAKNPFIPTQVLRQQKTPQREVKPTDETPTTEDVNKPSKGGESLKRHISSHTANTPETTSKVNTADEAKPATNQRTVTYKPSVDHRYPRKENAQSNTTDSKPQGYQPRRPKSRIAANFGAAKN